MVLNNGKTTSRKFSIISEANYAYSHVNKAVRYCKHRQVPVFREVMGRSVNLWAYEECTNANLIFLSWEVFCVVAYTTRSSEKTYSII